MSTVVYTSDLDPTIHAGRTARFAETDGHLRSGRLAYGRNPAYQRLDVRHWWLIIPAPGNVPFTSAALSLQWLPSHVAITIDDAPAPPVGPPKPAPRKARVVALIQ